MLPTECGQKVIENVSSLFNSMWFGKTIWRSDTAEQLLKNALSIKERSSSRVEPVEVEGVVDQHVGRWPARSHGYLERIELAGAPEVPFRPCARGPTWKRLAAAPPRSNSSRSVPKRDRRSLGSNQSAHPVPCGRSCRGPRMTHPSTLRLPQASQVTPRVCDRSWHRAWPADAASNC